MKGISSVVIIINKYRGKILNNYELTDRLKIKDEKKEGTATEIFLLLDQLRSNINRLSLHKNLREKFKKIMEKEGNSLIQNDLYFQINHTNFQKREYSLSSKGNPFPDFLAIHFDMKRADDSIKNQSSVVSLCVSFKHENFSNPFFGATCSLTPFRPKISC